MNMQTVHTASSDVPSDSHTSKLFFPSSFLHRRISSSEEPFLPVHSRLCSIIYFAAVETQAPVKNYWKSNMKQTWIYTFLILCVVLQGLQHRCCVSRVLAAVSKCWHGEVFCWHQSPISEQTKALSRQQSCSSAANFTSLSFSTKGQHFSHPGDATTSQERCGTEEKITEFLLWQTPLTP